MNLSKNCIGYHLITHADVFIIAGLPNLLEFHAKFPWNMSLLNLEAFDH